MKLRSLRIQVSLLAAALLAVAITGCDTSQEGDRCNPSLSHDECNSGLSCAVPPNCSLATEPHSPYANGEAYCCPTNGTSTNPNCNGSCNPCQFAASLTSAPGWCIDGGTPDPALDAEVE
jgi:hypothetical protein